MSDEREPWQGTGDAEELPPTEYSMVWRFVDQSPVFVLGVEAGVIYERMQRREALIQSTIHASNDEEAHNLANTMGYRVTLVPLDDGGFWMHATFHRTEERKS